MSKKRHLASSNLSFWRIVIDESKLLGQPCRRVVLWKTDRWCCEKKKLQWTLLLIRKSSPGELLGVPRRRNQETAAKTAADSQMAWHWKQRFLCAPPPLLLQNSTWKSLALQFWVYAVLFSEARHYTSTWISASRQHARPNVQHSESDEWFCPERILW